MRVLVTGGAGRLGARVCKILLEDGHRVRVLELDTKRNRKSIDKLGDGVEAVWGDVTDPDTVRQALQDVDGVAHMAGLLPPKTDQFPELAHRVNVGGTRLVVDLLKEKGGNIPFVFTSSVGVYGPTPGATEPITVERHSPNPQEPYAHTKLECENLIKESGIDYVILRMTGSMELDTTAIKLMFRVPLHSRMEFCHPDDLALAIARCIERFDIVKGKTMLVAGGPERRMVYRDILGGAFGPLGLPLPPAHKFSKVPYCIDWYDTAESQALLDYQRKSFEQFCMDLRRNVAGPFSFIVVPLMRYFIGPVFGRIIVRLL